jgi:hypothetical protein
MKIFCTEGFKNEYDALIKKKSYQSLEKQIIKFFIGTTVDQVNSSNTLNGGYPNPFIKKRLEGSGGYRIYYYLYIAKENIYLSFVHPKTGSMGRANITNKEIAALMTDTANAIETNNLYTLSKENEKLVFTK